MQKQIERTKQYTQPTRQQRKAETEKETEHREDERNRCRKRKAGLEKKSNHISERDKTRYIVKTKHGVIFYHF